MHTDAALSCVSCQAIPPPVPGLIQHQKSPEPTVQHVFFNRCKCNLPGGQESSAMTNAVMRQPGALSCSLVRQTPCSNKPCCKHSGAREGGQRRRRRSGTTMLPSPISRGCLFMFLLLFLGTGWLLLRLLHLLLLLLASSGVCISSSVACWGLLLAASGHWGAASILTTKAAQHGG